jgi:hypothetical protein
MSYRFLYPPLDKAGCALTDAFAGAMIDNQSFVHHVNAVVIFTLSALPTAQRLGPRVCWENPTSYYETAVYSDGTLRMLEYFGGYQGSKFNTSTGYVKANDVIATVIANSVISVYVNGVQVGIDYTMPYNYGNQIGYAYIPADGEMSNLLV